MQAFVDKNRGNASKASMAQSRLKAMSRLEVVAAIMDDPSLHFGFPEPEPLPTPILQAWAFACMHAMCMCRRTPCSWSACHHVLYCAAALTCLPRAAAGRRWIQLPWQARALPARGAGARHGEPRRAGWARTGPQPPWMPARPLTPPWCTLTSPCSPPRRWVPMASASRLCSSSSWASSSRAQAR